MHAPQYAIYEEGELHSDDFATVDQAVAMAKALLAQHKGPVTFSVCNEDGYLLASVTNRKICGVFYKQEWNSSDRAVDIDDVSFDATSTVLLLELDEIQDLRDNDESTDCLGGEYVEWDGPHYVRIVDAVLDYFGVDDLQDITEEALAFARESAEPKPPEVTTIHLALEVRVQAQAGVSMQEALDKLSIQVQSTIQGAVVLSTKVDRVKAEARQER